MLDITQGSSFDAIFRSGRDFIKHNRMIIGLLGILTGCLSVFTGSFILQLVQTSELDDKVYEIQRSISIENPSIEEISQLLESEIMPNIIAPFWQEYGIYIALTGLILIIIYTCIELILGYTYLEHQGVHTSSSIAQKISKAFSQLLPYIGTNLLYTVFIFIVLAIFIFGIIGFYTMGSTLLIVLLGILMVFVFIAIGVYMTFYKYVMINESIYYLDAFKTSLHIVEGRRWDTFGYLLILGLLIGLSSSILGSIFGMIALLISDPLISQGITNILTSAVSLAMSSLLFAFYLRRDQTTASNKSTTIETE